MQAIRTQLCDVKELMIILRRSLQNSILPIDRIQTGITTSGESKHESNDNKCVLYIPQTLWAESHHLMQSYIFKEVFTEKNILFNERRPF